MGEVQEVEKADRFPKCETHNKSKKYESADAESCCSLSTALSTEASQEEITRLAMMDKEVCKLSKKLRDMEKLEHLCVLDPLQRAKVAGKEQVMMDFESAKGLAESRVRNDLSVR